MTSEIQELVGRIERAEARCRRAERRNRVAGGLALAAAVGAVLLSPAASPAFAQGFGATLNQILARVLVLEQKTRFVTVTGTDMVIEGANVHIRNGLGATNGTPGDLFAAPGATNGLGNLVLGYNEARGTFGDERGGSHNLVVGSQHDYTSFGGIVAGQASRITAPFASVTGGRQNVASGTSASVSGGFGNLASGEFSSVSGGGGNSAGGRFASASGGASNIASGNSASVSGGLLNTAGGGAASVSGGRGRAALGDDDWRGGGLSQDF